MALAIILSYARPQNIARIVESLQAASRVDRILVSNNNPDVDLAPYLPASPKLELVQQARRFLPAKRFEIAARSGAAAFLCLDDDLFLEPAQIDRLLDEAARDPSVPHGVWGERYEVSQGLLAMHPGVRRFEGRVGILNRCYAFTAEHARRFFVLAGLLGFAGAEDIPLGDDVLLGFCGDDAPLCHDLGPLEDCPTANDPGVALWRREGFFAERGELLTRLLELPPECTPWWRARMEAFRREIAAPAQ